MSSDNVYNIRDLYGATSYTDDDGYHFLLLGDEGDVKFRVPNTECARLLLKSMEDIIDWVNEEGREFAAFRAASPEERAAVLGLTTEEAWSVRADLLREQADTARKWEREHA